MNNEEYQQLVKKYDIKENKLKNALIAFFTGGLVGFFAELFVFIIIQIFNLDRDVALTILCITVILSTSILTSLSKFDNFVSKVKMGILLPTTGFAHAMTSCALDYKKDDYISLGSNFFKLCGSVILYGIIFAFILALGRVILWLV